MIHESLLVVTAGGESIGKVIHHDGDDTFLAEGEKVFPTDFAFHYESNTGVCEEGALLFTLTDYSDEELAAIVGTSRRR
ncbi:MAG TPA: hypothetical protein VKZ18_14960 [Polyangia bacterium]|nr:hypothetical protein [Polyangia bacterium]